MEIWSSWTLVTLSGKPMVNRNRHILKMKYLCGFCVLLFWLNVLIGLYRLHIFCQLRKDKGTNMLLVSFIWVTSLLLLCLAKGILDVTLWFRSSIDKLSRWNRSLCLLCSTCYALLALCPGLQNRTFSRVHYTYYQMPLILLAPGIIFDQSVFVIS